MNEIKKEMIRRAREQYRDIGPCNTKKDLADCFTLEGNRICFWFNTSDQSTHMLISEM